MALNTDLTNLIKKGTQSGTTDSSGLLAINVPTNATILGITSKTTSWIELYSFNGTYYARTINGNGEKMPSTNCSFEYTYIV